MERQTGDRIDDTGIFLRHEAHRPYIPSGGRGALGLSTRGRFVGCNLLSPHPGRSAGFYAEVFGWKARLEQSDGIQSWVLEHEGRPVGAVLDTVEDLGARTMWVPAVLVDEPERRTDKAAELGGTPLEPAVDIPQLGRLSLLADPHGATVSPARPPRPPEPREPPKRSEVRDFTWHELLTPRPDQSIRFYQDLFDWGTKQRDLGGETYRMFHTENQEVAGIVPLETGGHGNSSWVSYLKVADAVGAARRVANLGGDVLLEPIDLPGVGLYALLIDPLGAHFGIIEPL